MKIAGLILVMIFSCGIGKYFTEKERKKVRLCGEICRFLEYLSHSVNSKRKTDDIIFRYCESNKDGIIKARSKKELLDFFSSLYFDEKFERLLDEIKTFLDEFGRLQDGKKESERCSTVLCGFKSVYEKYSLDFAKKEELYKKLGFICGIIVCIVFV